MTDLDQAKTDSKITRRTVAKGAAWTLPVVSLAAAAPTASASPIPCTNCVVPNAGVSTALSGLVANNHSVLTIPANFGAYVTCSGILSVGLVVVRGAKLTMSDGNEYTALALGAGVAAGIGGSSGINFTGDFTFSNVEFPNGNYIHANAKNAPVYPKKFVIRADVVLNLGVGTGTCPLTFTYEPTKFGASAGLVGDVLFPPATGVGGPLTWIQTWS